MMTIEQIRPYYPVELHGRSDFLLREYLQHNILQILFTSDYASRFVFIGGTCLRIMHQNRRFSEDLDFDNFGISEQNFTQVSGIIKSGLEKLGYQVEIRNVMRGAFHCYIRFPSILYQEGLSQHREARILINLDTEPQGYDFIPERIILNKFDVFVTVPCAPKSLLLSQKFCAMIGRKQPKGRDFFDAVFLLAQTKPDYGFLFQRLGITNAENLRNLILEKIGNFDFEMLARDVQPFLFEPNGTQRVLSFLDYLKQADL